MEAPLQAVQLSVFEWHILLQELEHNLNIINRDRRNTSILYDKIASQLAGTKIDTWAEIQNSLKAKG